MAVSCEVDNGIVRLAVKDQGPGMATTHQVPDITHPDRLNIEGAFGVPLMRRLSSYVNFETVDNGTIVQMELHQ